jgi:hypothetical protein
MSPQIYTTSNLTTLAPKVQSERGFGTMSLASVSSVHHFGTPTEGLDHRDELFELDAFQAIPGGSIDSAKLITLLRMKFGAGTYNMAVRYDLSRSTVMCKANIYRFRSSRIHTVLLHLEGSHK